LSVSTRDTCTENEENVIFGAKVGGKKFIDKKIKSKYIRNSKKNHKVVLFEEVRENIII